MQQEIYYVKESESPQKNNPYKYCKEEDAVKIKV